MTKFATSLVVPKFVKSKVFMGFRTSHGDIPKTAFHFENYKVNSQIHPRKYHNKSAHSTFCQLRQVSDWVGNIVGKAGLGIHMHIYECRMKMLLANVLTKLYLKCWFPF